VLFCVVVLGRGAWVSGSGVASAILLMLALGICDDLLMLMMNGMMME
jgi:hypothetical protein